MVQENFSRCASRLVNARIRYALRSEILVLCAKYSTRVDTVLLFGLDRVPAKRGCRSVALATPLSNFGTANPAQDGIEFL